MTSLQAARSEDFAGDQALTERLIEQMGLIFAAESMPRIAGRLFGLFLVEGRTLNIHQIADRLVVSRASVSTNARMLEGLGVLERVGVPGDRQDFYALAHNPYHRLLIGLVTRMKHAHDALVEAADGFAPAMAATSRRVRGLAVFFLQSSQAVGDLLDSYSGSSEPQGRRQGAD